MKNLTVADAAPLLMAHGYAPCALGLNGAPAAYWEDRQPDLSDASLPVGVLSRCAPPRRASDPVRAWRGSWLALVRVKDAPAEIVDDLDAYIGPQVPTLIEGATRTYVFRRGAFGPDFKEGRIERLGEGYVTLSIGTKAEFLPLAGEWVNGSLLDVPVSALPVLDESAAKELAENFRFWLSTHEPQKPAYVPPPPVVLETIPGQPLKWGNVAARSALRQHGYRPVPVSAEGHPVAGTVDTDPALSDLAIGLETFGRDTMLSVVEVDWSTTPELAAALAKIPDSPPSRSAEVAEGIVARLANAAENGVVAVRREDTRVTLVYRNDNGAFDRLERDYLRSAMDARGMPIANSHVRVTARNRRLPVVLGGEGWSLDFLKTPRASLAALSFDLAWVAVDEWLRSGAGLADAPKRGRKAAA